MYCKWRKSGVRFPDRKAKKSFVRVIALLAMRSNRAYVSLSRLSHNLSFVISLILSEKLTSSTADDESSSRKGIAVEAQLTSGKSKSTAHNNCGFIIQLAIFSLVCFIVIVSMFRIQAFLFGPCSYFFLVLWENRTNYLLLEQV